MKRILIVIYDLRIGGAQKSLLSFLQAFSASDRKGEYEIHVMPFNPAGEFLSQIPAGICIDEPPRVLRWMSTKLNGRLLFKYFSLRGLVGELCWVICKKCGMLPEHINIQQQLWHVWKHFVPRHRAAYDAAISYIDGTANYYVMEKVQAKKKTLWVHNDYEKLNYCAAYDVQYYDACDAAITISQACKEALLRAHPRCEKKLHVLENITAVQSVVDRSQEGLCPEFSGRKGLKLLTVGRLHTQKGLDMAIDAARILQDAGLAFTWLVAGEGAERASLEKRIREAGVERSFFLIGSKQNPYTYMRECDILVQTSRYEGKSIVLDEAKILCKPIVSTCYSTVHDAIVHGETGWITDMNAESIAQGVMTLAKDAALREQLIHTLEQMPKGNEEELGRYFEIMM